MQRNDEGNTNNMKYYSRLLDEALNDLEHIHFRRRAFDFGCPRSQTSQRIAQQQMSPSDTRVWLWPQIKVYRVSAAFIFNKRQRSLCIVRKRAASSRGLRVDLGREPAMEGAHTLPQPHSHPCAYLPPKYDAMDFIPLVLVLASFFCCTLCGFAAGLSLPEAGVEAPSAPLPPPPPPRPSSSRLADSRESSRTEGLDIDSVATDAVEMGEEATAPSYPPCAAFPAGDMTDANDEDEDEDEEEEGAR
jgi:hypothetical protein